MPSKVRSHQCYFFSNSHLCSSLLRNQLIPVQNDSFPDFAVISTQGSPGVNALITEKPVQIFSRMGTGGVASTTNSNSGSSTGSYCNVLPPFPALSKAHTMPAGTKSDDFWDQNERIRKRASSDEEDIDNRSKQARVANGAIFNDAVTHHADERLDFKAAINAVYFDLKTSYWNP